MTALGIVIVGIGALMIFSAFQDYPGSDHAGGPLVNLGRAFRPAAASNGFTPAQVAALPAAKVATPITWKP